MNITKENIDDLNAVLSVSVGPSDYEDRVKSVLNDYRKKAKVPGFRPGKVPFGMVKKMYGKSVLADELNKVVYDNLHKYIQENSIEILGNPLPSDDLKIDLDSNDDFEFKYEIGLQPQFDVKITDKEKFTVYDIQVSDEIIDKQITDLAKRYGKVSEGEKCEASDMIQGDFVELDKDGKIVEGGIMHTSTVALEFIEDKKVAKKLVGTKVGDVLTLDPHKVSRGGADTAAMLGIEQTQLDSVTTDFQFTAQKIFQIAPADVNQELFDKIFGPGQVADEKAFRAKIAEDMTKMLEAESEKKLKMDISDKLMDQLDLSLPDTFLKKWLLKSNGDKLTNEQIEAEYDQYAKNLRWQLIENKIVSANDIKVEPAEAVEKAKELITAQYAQYGGADILGEEQLAEMAQNILSNQEEGKKIYEMMFDEKITNLFKTTFKLKNKEVTLDEFVKLATEKPGKFKLLDGLKNLTNKK